MIPVECLSLAAQRTDRIDPARAPGRNQSCDHRDRDERGEGAGDGQRIAIFRNSKILSAFDRAIVVLVARSNRLEDLRPLAPRVLEAFATVESGTVTVVGP